MNKIGKQKDKKGKLILEKLILKLRYLTLVTESLLELHHFLE